MSGGQGQEFGEGQGQERVDRVVRVRPQVARALVADGGPRRWRAWRLAGVGAGWVGVWWASTPRGVSSPWLRGRAAASG